MTPLFQIFEQKEDEVNKETSVCKVCCCHLLILRLRQIFERLFHKEIELTKIVFIDDFLPIVLW